MSEVTDSATTIAASTAVLPGGAGGDDDDYQAFQAFPLGLSYFVLVCILLSLLSSLFVLVSLPARGLSVVVSPLSHVYGQALFDGVFAVALLTNFLAADPVALAANGWLTVNDAAEYVNGSSVPPGLAGAFISVALRVLG
jgi:hypothetical protein